MNRRTLLRTSAAAVGGGGAALAGLQLASEASAQTELTLDIAGDSAALGSNDSVTSVWLDAEIEWAYDLPDSASPSIVVIELAAAKGDADLSVVDSAESAQLFTAAQGTETFSVDLIASETLSAADLTPDSGTEETTVTVEARLRVEASDGSVLARESTSDTAVLSVERDGLNASEYGDVGGSGTLTIETGSD